jgi:hypothetical protein
VLYASFPKLLPGRESVYQTSFEYRHEVHTNRQIVANAKS